MRFRISYRNKLLGSLSFPVKADARPVKYDPVQTLRGFKCSRQPRSVVAKIFPDQETGLLPGGKTKAPDPTKASKTPLRAALR